MSGRSGIGGRRILSLLCLMLTLTLGLPARVEAQTATTISVTTLDDEQTDDGDCSLREAITAANTDGGVDACPAGSAADTITFSESVTGTIMLASTLPAIEGELTIDGPGAAALIISGNHSVQVLQVGAGATLHLQGVTVANGNSVSGGGILNDGGRLTVSNGTFQGNSGRFRGGGIFNAGGTLTVSNSAFIANSAIAGSGIFNFNDGSLEVTNSTFQGNSATFGGSGILNDGSRLTVTNSTFQGNSVPFGSGGGIFNFNQGRLEVSNSTFQGNFASFGGGIRTIGTATVRNTIIANNARSNCFGTITDGGGNLRWPTTDLTCRGTFGDPMLGPLQDNGGPTFTMALLPGSAAIDAVVECTDLSGNPLSTDQRGVTRPHDGDADGTARCDSGAYEVPAPARMTGGGRIGQVRVSFVAQLDPSGTVSGHFNASDLQAGVQLRGSVTAIVDSATQHFVFHVTIAEGCTLTVTAADHGEPGRGTDQLRLVSDACSTPISIPEHTPLSQGNLQWGPVQ